MKKPKFLPFIPKTLTNTEGNRCLAPDGSSIRELLHTRMGSFAECTLPPNNVSKAVTHRTIDEIWYVVAGEGEMARKFQQGTWAITAIKKGDCITIPLGTHFQFRNSTESDLKIILCAMPPWPGDHESIEVESFW